MNQINVVPYIDVMLVLLVIFMVTAPMMPTGTVDLPSVDQSSQAQADPLVVHINNKSGGFILKNRTAGSESSIGAPEELVAQIQAAQQEKPDRGVVIEADKGIQYAEVMNVLNLLKNNRISKVGLLVKNDSGK